MKTSLIFTGDNEFQVLNIVHSHSDEAWEVANQMAEDGTFKEMNVDHYDVVEFDSIGEANKWMLQQVKDGRKTIVKSQSLEKKYFCFGAEASCIYYDNNQDVDNVIKETNDYCLYVYDPDADEAIGHLMSAFEGYGGYFEICKAEYEALDKHQNENNG